MANDLVVIPDNVRDLISWLPNSNFFTRGQAFVHFSSRGVEAYIIMGAVLCTSRDANDWEKANCRNMKEYCENELRISYTQAIRMMTIWDKLNPYIIKHYETIKNISFVNLYEVARVAALMNDVQLIALFDQAALDTERGFKDNIREIEGKKAHDACDHMNADKWFYKCQRCNKLVPLDVADVKKKVEEDE